MGAGAWDDELTVEYARLLVGSTSPEELAVFDAMAPTFLARGADAQPRGDGSLGFGADFATISTVVVPVANVVGAVLVAAAADLAAQGTASGLKEALRRLIRRDRDAPVVPPTIVERARTAALEQATALGLTGDQASLLANAVAGSLTATPQQ